MDGISITVERAENANRQSRPSKLRPASSTERTVENPSGRFCRPDDGRAAEKRLARALAFRWKGRFGTQERARVPTFG